MQVPAVLPRHQGLEFGSWFWFTTKVQGARASSAAWRLKAEVMPP